MTRRVGARSSSRTASAATPNATAAASRPTRSSRNSDAAAVLATPPAVQTPTPTQQVKSLRLRQRRVPEPDPPTPPRADSDEPMPDVDAVTSPAVEEGEEEVEEEEGGGEQSEATADADDGPTTGHNSDDAAGEAEEDDPVEDGESGVGADGSDADQTSNPSTPFAEQSTPSRGRGSRGGRRGRGGGRILLDWGTPRSPAAGAGDETSEAGPTPIVKRRRGRPPVNGVSSHTPRSARGGFRGRPRGRGSHTPATRHAIDKEGNTLPIVNDEVAATPDPEGEVKVDINGNLLGGREYRVRTFSLAGRGDRLYMLSTEPARCTGYRDSYLFFTKHMPLHKIIIEEYEKHDLIDREVIPHSYKGRAIGVVTARSVFREFGSKIVVGGKKVIDDYYAQKSRDRGDVEGELADPFDRLPPDGQPYNKNQYVAWHGASQVYHSQLGGAPGTGAPGMVAGLGGKRKPVITSANWMYEHALAASRFNSAIIGTRKSTHEGIYDPHTNLVHYPRALQPTRVRWEYVSDSETPLLPPSSSSSSSFSNAITTRASSGTKRSFDELVNGERGAHANVNEDDTDLHYKAIANEHTNGTLTPPDSSHGAVHVNGHNSLDTEDGNIESNKRVKIDHHVENAVSYTPFCTESTLFPTPSRVLANNFLVVDTHLLAAPPSLTTASIPNSDFCGEVQSTLPDPYDPAYVDLPEDCREELLDATRRERQWRNEWLHAPLDFLAPASSTATSSSAMTTTTNANGRVLDSASPARAAAGKKERSVLVKKEEGTSEAAWANFASLSGRAGMLRSLGLFL